MTLVQQWQHIQNGLPPDWGDARLALTISDDGLLERAAGLLGPLMPGRSGSRLRFLAVRDGAGPSTAAVERALARLDDERIDAKLELVSAATSPPGETAAPRPILAAAWDEAIATLPSDWSDLYAEIELTSTDYLEPAALALAPVNPSRYDTVAGFRFRVARRFGYGASPGMARRCLARLDEAGIPGELRILRSLSDTKPVDSQGPVWYVGGKVV